MERDLLNVNSSDWLNDFLPNLKKGADLSIRHIVSLLGVPKDVPARGARGSLFIHPANTEFSVISVNPDVDLAENGHALVTHIGFWESQKPIRIRNLNIKYRKVSWKQNTYDGGYQILFYKVNEDYAFTGFSSQIDRESFHDWDVPTLEVNNLQFHFGKKLVEYRDGFSLMR